MFPSNMQMISGKIIRTIYTSQALWDLTKKSLLAQLRKRTGYTFANCRKALELHQNDIEKAESWLKEQAQALGWAKAQKLQTRATCQGLIAAIIDKQHAALIEINCETDFVAKNEKFLNLAETAIKTVLNYANTLPIQGNILRKNLYADTLKNLTALDGKTLADHSALTIGNIGENINLKRALCFAVAPDIQLAGCTHPCQINSKSILHGKYGALIAYKTADNNQQIAAELCQHIIGMNPRKIGDPNIDQPNKNEEDETALIFQEFLLDADSTVQQILEDSNTEILDFARFELGQSEQDQVLDNIETCG